MQVSLHSFSITDTLYNVPEDVYFTYKSRAAGSGDPGTDHTFLIPAGNYNIQSIADLFTQLLAPEAEFRYFMPMKRVSFVASSGYEIWIDASDNDPMLYLLELLGFTYLMEEFGPDYEGDEQWTLSNQYELFIRCPSLLVESQAAGWQSSDKNILARVAVDLSAGRTSHYEPSVPIVIPYRLGQLSELEFEILDKFGESVPMEEDTQWTVTLQFQIVRADRLVDVPTSVNNPLAPAYYGQSREQPVDTLKRKFETAP